MLTGKVWIYRLLFVCTVTDFCTEDKASGVKCVIFCSAVHRRPKSGNLPFLWTLLPQNSKIGRIGQSAVHAHPHVNITVEMRRRKRHASDAPFMELCGVWTYDWHVWIYVWYLWNIDWLIAVLTDSFIIYLLERTKTHSNKQEHQGKICTYRCCYKRS